MNTPVQKALTAFVTKKVKEGETIESLPKTFYSSATFADNADEAKEFL
ncbi:MAG TPA: hypothetical protein VFC67_26660 [Prolixibacteraceae bacterium]|nr:hypothetical protein [Prolixibacteraceae bacterium]